MLRQLGFLFAALAFFSLAGGHWAVLQSVAWAGMLRDYTQKTGSVVAAVEQTFDGEHPCELCREIAAAKAKEQKERPATPAVKDEAKAKAIVVNTVALPLSPSTAVLARALDVSSFGSARAEQPLIPPPRGGSNAA